MNFTFGTDPEFMLRDKKHTLKSAIGLLPKRSNARPVGGNYYYYDNVLAEIAIKPANNKEEAVHNIRNALFKLAQLVHPIKIEVCCAENYPKQELKHEDAIIAGCNPEWNAYTLQCMLPPEEVISQTSFRTAGGHIHLGSDLLSDSNNIITTIKMMDLFIGIPSLFLDPDFSSRKRRKIYGHAGTHRVTEYGLEYRALGNFWFSSPEFVCLVYDLCSFVLEFVKDKEYKKFWFVNKSLLEEEDPSIAYQCFGYNVNKLIKSINQCDIKSASKFMTLISHYLPRNILEQIDNLRYKKMPNIYSCWNIKCS